MFIYLQIYKFIKFIKNIFSISVSLIYTSTKIVKLKQIRFAYYIKKLLFRSILWYSSKENKFLFQAL